MSTGDITEPTSQTVAAGQLRAFVERVERLHEERRTIAEDISEIFSEAKACGFDTRAMKACIKLRAMDQAAREEQEIILDLYKAALGIS